MKRFFYITLISLVTLSAQADDFFKHGGIRYKIESFIDQELMVTYPEESDFSTIDLVIPATIKTKQGQVWTVTAIGDRAFSAELYEAGYKSLRSITIPKTITKIHPDAFIDSKIEKMTVNCAMQVPLKHLQKNLTTLNLGQQAIFKGMKEDFFTNLESIRNITVDPKNTAFSVIDGVLYNKDKTILLCFPQGKSILRMPATLRRFAQTEGTSFYTTYVFRPGDKRYEVIEDIKDIKEIYFNSNIKEIYPWTFENCKNLKVVVFPQYLEKIGFQAFRNTALENVSLPNTLISIGNLAFSGTQLEKIIIPNSVRTVGESAFSRCSSLKEVTLSNSMTEIPNGMFEDCKSLETIIIPNSVQTVGSSEYGTCLFRNCSSLKKITLSNAMTEIPRSMFFELKSLETIIIPNSIKKIHGNAFFGCSGLKGITIQSVTPPLLSDDNVNFPFDYTNCPIYVPSGSVEAYKKATYWSKYADRIRSEKESVAGSKETESVVGSKETKADASNVYAQKVQPATSAYQPDNGDTKVYEVLDEMPVFPGGMNAMWQFLAANLHYPAVCEENGIQGRVLIQFIVEKDGSFSNVKVVKSVDPALDNEALRIAKSMPKWTPGKLKGELVRVKYTMPISFKLQ